MKQKLSKEEKVELKKKKKENWKKLKRIEKADIIICWVIRIMAFGLFVYGILGWIFRPNDTRYSRYVIFIIQSIYLFAFSFTPAIFAKIFKVRFSYIIEIAFQIFILCCFFVGEICEFYVYVSWWDDLLHTFSGAYLTIIGFTIVYFLNSSSKVPMKVAPFFMLFFAFCLTCTVELCWEAVEFFSDSFLGTNMQRFMDSATGEIYVGQKALSDTMGDILETIAGSVVALVVGFLDLKKNENPQIEKLKLIALKNFKQQELTNSQNKEKEEPTLQNLNNN